MFLESTREVRETIASTGVDFGEIFDFQHSGIFRWPQPPVFSQKYCRTNGRRTAVQMGGVLQYKWEVYCWVSLSSRLRSQEGPAIQMGGVLPYKLEVYCRTFFETSRGWGFRNSSMYCTRMFWQCKCLMYCIFLSWSPSLAADNHGAWVGLIINCLAARNLVFNFPLFL